PGFCVLRRIQSFRCTPWAESRKGGGSESRRQGPSHPSGHKSPAGDPSRDRKNKGTREQGAREQGSEGAIQRVSKSADHSRAKATTLGPSAAEHSMGAMCPHPEKTSSWDCGMRRCMM